jgi:hypothetical protein
VSVIRGNLRKMQASMHCKTGKEYGRKQGKLIVRKLTKQIMKASSCIFDKCYSSISIKHPVQRKRTLMSVSPHTLSANFHFPSYSR